MFYGIDNISSYHLKTLERGNWLSGDVINGFLRRLESRSSTTGSCVRVFSSYLYPALQGNNFRKDGVIYEAMSTDPLKFNLLMFPINFNDHWTLVICYPNSCLLVYLDSLHTINILALESVLSFIKTIFSAYKHDFNVRRWLLLAPNDIPRQEDSCSCGVYMCMNAFAIAEDNSITYSAENIGAIRKWIVHFIITETPSKKEKNKSTFTLDSPVRKEVHVNGSEVQRTVPPSSDFLKYPVFHRINLLATSRSLVHTTEDNEDKGKTDHSSKCKTGGAHSDIRCHSIRYVNWQEQQDNFEKEKTF